MLGDLVAVVDEDAIDQLVLNPSQEQLTAGDKDDVVRIFDLSLGISPLDDEDARARVDGGRKLPDGGQAISAMTDPGDRG